MANNDRQIGWITALAFASPSFAFAGHEIAYGMFLPYFLSQISYLSLPVVAALILAYEIWDTVNGPLIGYISDRWPAGQHRRFAPMLWGTPLAIASTGALFWGAHAMSLAGLAATLWCTGLGWNMINVPHGAWALEYAADASERTRIFAARNLVGFAAVPLFSLAPAVLEHWGARSAQEGPILAGIIMVSQPLSLVWLRSAMKITLTGGRPPAREPTAGQDWRRIFGMVLAEPDSRPLLALFALIGAFNAIKGGLLLFWVRMGLGLADWGWTLILLQSLAGAAAVPFWLRLHRRVGTRRSFEISLYASLLAAASIVLVPKSSATGLVIYGIANGAVTGASFMLLRSLLGSLLDRLQAGRAGQLAGVLYSGFHFVYNIAAALGIFLALSALSRLGFDPKHAASGARQPSDAITWVIAGAAGGLTLLAILAARKSARPQTA